MKNNAKTAASAGPSHRTVEIAVAVITGIFALVVIWGSYQIGIGWDVDGPRAGFFPFYVALLILAASIVNFGAALNVDPRPDFATWPQLRQVGLVLLPSAIYVALIPFLGLYVMSVLLIAFFMYWLGRYGPGMIAAVALGVPIATFFVFEKWFLVPLPKGPVESLFGY
jgi:hypothetical protein